MRGNQTTVKPKMNPDLDSDIFPMRMDSDTDSIIPIRDKAFTTTKKKRAAFMNNMKGSLSIVSFNKDASSMRSNDERPDLIYKIDENPKPFKIDEIGEHLESE